jgi:hypothetical protein
VNVLNGADGLGEIAAGLVGQGMTILESVRRGVPAASAGQTGTESLNGSVPAADNATR